MRSARWRSTNSMKRLKACPNKGRHLGGEHLHPLRLRREGGHVPAAYLAAEGASGCACSGVRAALRHSDQIRHLRRDCRFGEHFPREHGVGQPHSCARSDYDAGRRGAGGVFRQSQAHAGLLLDEPDRLHSHGHRDGLPAGRRKRAGRARRAALYGQPFALQADSVHGGWRGLHEPA